MRFGLSRGPFWFRANGGLGLRAQRCEEGFSGRLGLAARFACGAEDCFALVLGDISLIAVLGFRFESVRPEKIGGGLVGRSRQ